jgi:hypothetical protein
MPKAGAYRSALRFSLGFGLAFRSQVPKRFFGNVRKCARLKVGRDKVNSGSGRALVVLKVAIVDVEFGRLGLNLRMQRGTSRMVSTMAYEAGGVVGNANDPKVQAGQAQKANFG